MKATRAALTPIWVVTRRIADMKTIYKLYFLVGENWFCSGAYTKYSKAREAELILKQQGGTTMIRRVCM